MTIYSLMLTRCQWQRDADTLSDIELLYVVFILQVRRQRDISLQVRYIIRMVLQLLVFFTVNCTIATMQKKHKS